MKNKSNQFSNQLADYADGPSVSQSEVAHQNILLLMERFSHITDSDYNFDSFFPII
jgi:hypothetical protein